MIASALTRRAVLGRFGLGGFAAAAAAGAHATLPDGAVPIEFAGGHCLVTVSLDGRPARLVLDTGAELTLVTRAAAARLGLRPDEWVATTLRGLSGTPDRHANVVVEAGSLGGVNLMQRVPMRQLSLPVSSLELPLLADGLLGGDLLRHYTVDLYLAGGWLALRPPEQPVLHAGAMPLQVWRRNLLLAPVRLDGHALVALVDTGASGSLINARGLYRLGLTPEQTRLDPKLSAIGVTGAFAAHARQFRELRVGGLAIDRPVLATDVAPEAGYDMVLGLDLLGRQRVLISYAAPMLGFAP